MKISELVESLITLPLDLDIDIITNRYNGTGEVYEESRPLILIGEKRAIITGNLDWNAQRFVGMETFDLPFHKISRTIEAAALDTVIIHLTRKDNK